MMPRQKKAEDTHTKMVSMRLTPEGIALLKQQSDLWGVSQSALVEIALRRNSMSMEAPLQVAPPSGKSSFPETLAEYWKQE